MVSLSKNVALSGYSAFVNAVYGVPNDRHYTYWDMLTNIQRFSMRCIKGVRKNNREKTKLNMLIAFSWFTSLMNRLHIDVSEVVWVRFPYLCSYCGKQPCVCKEEKIKTRRRVVGNDSIRPSTIEEFQTMFSRIYPSENRTRQDAAIHLAEETGELSEAFHLYMSDRSDLHFKKVCMEAADFFSCTMGVLNSLDISCADELSKLFANNCHICHNIPCTCTFKSVSEFKS
jgi:NTP pyrophosphatase (non-canonical NTP hydrolase)